MNQRLIDGPWSGRGRFTKPPEGLIIHSMGEHIQGHGHATDFLKSLKYSVHTMIPPEGGLLICQSETDKANHAGISEWLGQDDLNDTHLGVELLLEGTHTWASFKKAIQSPNPYTQAQYETLAAYCRDLIYRYKWSVDDLILHSECSGPDVRNDYKIDPGRGFKRNSLIRMI